MTVWLLKWTNCAETNSSVWYSEEDAKIQCCAEIVESIQTHWDLTLPDQLIAAKHINSLIASKNYIDIISYWNDFNVGYDQYEIVEHNVFRLPSHIGDLNIAEEQTKKQPANSVSFVAANPGATCRCCNNYNEYVYADRCDSTYQCRQCVMFNNIFN